MPTTALTPGGGPGQPYSFTAKSGVDPARYRFLTMDPDNGQLRRSDMRFILIADGSVVPDPPSGFAVLYIDSADGQLKVKDSAGTVEALTTTL